MKRSTEAKVDWAVTAYSEWREEHLRTFNYDPAIYFSDLSQLDKLMKDNFNHALCRFIPEVTKKREDGPYPGATLYQMIVALQKYLVVNKWKWKLIDSDNFEESRTVLDNVMRERTAANVGVVKRQAGIITFEHENELWQKGILGEDTPDKLRHTVFFLLGINVYLRAVEEHYNLCRNMLNEQSQLKFMSNPKGDKCLVFQEDSTIKTHDGVIKDPKHDRKVVWVYPNVNMPSRYPVKLVEKYLSLCPQYYKKANFYLQSLQKPTPTQWYDEQVVGQNTISKVVKNLMKDAKIEGFLTNHSARRTGGTRLFRAGVQYKLVKEAMGHMSNAIDKYQITSHEQREMMSKVIAGQHATEVREVKEPKIDQDIVKIDVGRSTSITISQGSKTSSSATSEITADQIGSMISNVIKEQKDDGKTVIKIQIEISKE